MKKYLSISFFIVLLDQLSKIYIKFSPTFPENTSVNILGSFFRITFFNPHHNPSSQSGLNRMSESFLVRKLEGDNLT